MQVSPKELAELKANFMELYDDNKDGKIEIREVGLQVSAATYMPPGVCCYNYIARYLLPTMFCQESAARFMLPGLWWKMSAARCMLPGVYCLEISLLVYAARSLLSVVYCHVRYLLSCVSCQESLTRGLLP